MIKNKKQKNITYIWWKDKRMVWTIVLITAIVMQIFAWFQIPFLSSINAYTVGMLIGFYNPLFYFAIIMLALLNLFSIQVKVPSWIKMNWKIYIFLSLSIIFIGVSTSYYQSKTSYLSIGDKPWHTSFNYWFSSFTSSSSAWVPTNTNGGIIGAFMYSFVAMIISGIGAFIFSIAIMILSLSITTTGTFIGFYRKLIVKKNLQIKMKEKKSVEKLNINDEVKAIDDSDEIDKEKDSFPFDDPFK